MSRRLQGICCPMHVPCAFICHLCEADYCVSLLQLAAVIIVRYLETRISSTAHSKLNQVTTSFKRNSGNILSHLAPVTGFQSCPYNFKEAFLWRMPHPESASYTYSYNVACDMRGRGVTVEGAHFPQPEGQWGPLSRSSRSGRAAP